MAEQCDCTAWCGDDPWIKDGRTIPCADYTNHFKRLATEEKIRKLLDELNYTGDTLGALEELKRLRVPPR